MIKKNILFVLDNNNEINYYYKILANYLNRNNILKLPSWDNTPYAEISPSQNILNERFKSFNYENNDFRIFIIHLLFSLI